ncbi:hypothetical protein NDU88_005413 [Pleurodeles waltl]|uniref:Uncharacterized protein n=1 Tax=Pleurodeles waltl TaxID=8319 RepID=A0AAV7WCM9_PLEWA|nr:hypothetical protein NDU88_005413 [Pleurodeles waltl]
MEPSLGAIIMAIQDLKTTLEPKLDAVMVDVSLLRADFQKMSEKVKRKRPSFDEVKKSLCAKNIKYMMIFPAPLRVMSENRSWFFNTPAEA